jgi:hypothetical protein
MDNFRQQFSATIFGNNFRQQFSATKFSATIFGNNFRQQFSAGISLAGIFGPISILLLMYICRYYVLLLVPISSQNAKAVHKITA